jgi:hypothetical protein
MKLRAGPPLPEERARNLFYKLGGYDLHRMKLYVGDMRSLLLQQKDKLTKLHKSELKKYSDFSEMINNSYASQYLNYDKHFIGILNNSALVASCALFEVMFTKVCKYIAKKRKYELEENPFGQTQIIDRCRSTLQNKLGIDLVNINNDSFLEKAKLVDDPWTNISLGRNLRNKIIHHHAIIPLANNELIKHVRENKYIQAKKIRYKQEVRFFINDQKYVKVFLDNSRDYLIYILFKFFEEKANTRN